MIPLVTIITPVYNAGEMLEDTIISILEQTYLNIEYIIIDGGSTDSTLSIIKKYEDKIAHIISESDHGMYDAIAKGFSIANGEIICYLNAGDLFYPSTIETVVNVFKLDSVQWLTGYRSVCNVKNVLTRVELPFRYKNKLIQRGSYGQRLPYIQQESTFWRKSLLDLVNLEKFRNLKVAGDYYLWYCFSIQNKLEIISAPLGIFKVHSGQLSEGLSEYFSEIVSFTKKPNIFTRIEELWEKFFWAMIPKVREFFFKNIWKYDHQKQKWLKL